MIKNKLPLSRYIHTLLVLDTTTKIGYENNFNDKEIFQLQIADYDEIQWSHLKKVIKLRKI